MRSQSSQRASVAREAANRADERNRAREANKQDAPHAPIPAATRHRGHRAALYLCATATTVTLGHNAYAMGHGHTWSQQPIEYVIPRIVNGVPLVVLGLVVARTRQVARSR